MDISIRHSDGAMRVGFAVLAALLLVAGCGGGDNTTASRQAFTQGTITGFGSIIVNGIRFDESMAQVSDDDGQAHDASELKLGMNVEVESSDIDRVSNSARASHVRFGAAIVGPVSAINTGTTPKTLTVLDQIVEISNTTVFDDSLANGLDSIMIDDVIEVHALLDTATGHYLAKRIEADPGATVFKLRGVVADLDSTAKTFRIGGAPINFAGVANADLPPNFANDLKVRVRMQTVKNGDGAWVAVSIRSGERRVEDHEEAEVHGTITDFTSLTSFSVNGLPVDASGAAFPDGTAGIEYGAEVEVQGAIVNGVLVATRVELEDHHRNDDRNRCELHGLISGLNTQAKTFVVRGVTVHYNSATTVFQGGTEADLANDRLVEVKGSLSSNGTTVEASLIRFEASPGPAPMPSM